MDNRKIWPLAAQNERGFTLLEILMALLLIAILSVVGITAFVNYSKDAKNSATKSNLQIIRNGIATQFANLVLHCANNSSTWPATATLSANDITIGNTDGGTTGQCTLADVPNVNDRQFVSGLTALPVNPWGLGVTVAQGGIGNKIWDCTAVASVGANTVAAGVWTATVGGPTDSCKPSNNFDCAVALGVTAYTGLSTALTNDGWCYDPTSGRIWPNSANNGTIGVNSESNF